MKQNRKMSTCNWLYLESLGSWWTMPKKFLGIVAHLTWTHIPSTNLLARWVGHMAQLYYHAVVFSHWGGNAAWQGVVQKIKMWLLPGKPLDKLQNTIKLQVAFYPIAMNTRFVFYLVKKITSHMYCHVQYICEVKHFYTFDYCNPGLQGPPRPCAQPERLHNQKRPRWPIYTG